jgi:hypothetical protein
MYGLPVSLVKSAVRVVAYWRSPPFCRYRLPGSGIHVRHGDTTRGGSVATLFAAFFFFTGLMLALGIPLFAVARRKGRTKTTRRFLIAAGVIGLSSAVVAASSERLVRQCETAGGLDCIDFGSAGLQFLFIVGYVISSWVVAVIINQE